jgi:hypothetical protein
MTLEVKNGLLKSPESECRFLWRKHAIYTDCNGGTTVQEHIYAYTIYSFIQQAIPKQSRATVQK